jgi:hypothetical protein
LIGNGGTTLEQKKVGLAAEEHAAVDSSANKSSELEHACCWVACDAQTEGCFGGTCVFSGSSMSV